MDPESVDKAATENRQKPRRRRYSIGMVIFSILVYTLAAYSAVALWGIYSLIMMVSPLLYYPIHFLLLLGAGILICWWCGRQGNRLAQIAGVLLCGSLLYGAVGYYVYLVRITNTLEYVDRAIPVLDRVKSESGIYPMELPIQLIGQPDGFLNLESYRSNGEVYCFEFHDGMNLWRCYELLSDEKEWLSYHSRHHTERSAARYQFPK